MNKQIISKNNINLILSISILNILIYLLTTALTSYGLFRDEFYYLACASRPDLGYVDHPPFSIWVLAGWTSLFGDSLFSIRIIPAIISSLTVFILGLFTLRLGGGKTAVIIATLSFMLSPIFLGMNTIFSMNTFDFLFWILSAYLFLRIIQTGEKKRWIILGIVIGIGLLNKTSMFWLSSGILIGTIFSPLREDLRTKYPYLAALLALIIFSPYIIWNLTHDLAHFEFMRNAASRKYGGLTPVSFIADQILILNPVSFLIWLPGISFFFINREGKRYRAVGIIWLITFLILIINWHSKGEYISAAYQILFAGGAITIEKLNNKKQWVRYVASVPVIISAIILSPLARPLLAPEKLLQFQDAIGLKPPSNEGHETILPQFYSDMFGWEELARNVSSVYKSIPEAERNNTFVFCSNYGRAGAIEYYSKKYSLPAVVSPHNNYWYWWPDIDSDATIIIIGGEREEHLQALETVIESGYHYSEFSMPYENNLKIFVGRGLKVPIQSIRQNEKIFI